MKKRSFNSLMLKLTEVVEEGDDEQCLVALATLLQRISMSTRIVQEDDGVIYSQIAMFICGDKVLGSMPSPFEVPMIPAMTATQVLH